MTQLTVWTIYRHPSDYPDSWVMRGHEVVPSVGIVRPHDSCFVASTLDELRAKVPPGTFRVDRAPQDNPAIYECWLPRTDPAGASQPSPDECGLALVWAADTF